MPRCLIFDKTRVYPSQIQINASLVVITHIDVVPATHSLPNSKMSTEREVLSKITCAQLLDRSSAIHKAVSHYSKFPESPVHIDASVTMKDACRVLSSNNISSAPIYDAETKSFIGLLEYYDLATHVLEVLSEVPIQDSHTLDWVL
jgi:predicted transcriptional regulator